MVTVLSVSEAELPVAESIASGDGVVVGRGGNLYRALPDVFLSGIGGVRMFNTRTEATLNDTGSASFIFIGDLLYAYDVDGTALTTGDDRTWSPYSWVSPNHFAENATPGTTDMADALEAAWAFSKHIRFLGETYAFTRKVTLEGIATSGVEGYSLKGAGWGATFFEFTNAADGGLHLSHKPGGTGWMQGNVEGIAIFPRAQTTGYALRLTRVLNSNFRDVLIDGAWNHVELYGSAQNRFFGLNTRNVKRGSAANIVWGLYEDTGTSTRSFGNELIACEHQAGQDSAVGFSLTAMDMLTITGGHFDYILRKFHIHPDGTGKQDHVFDVRANGTYFDANSTAALQEFMYIEATDGGSGATVRIEGIRFNNCFIRGGTNLVKLATTEAGVAGLSSLEDFMFTDCEIQDFSGRLFQIENTFLADPEDTIRQFVIASNIYNDGGILSGRTNAPAFARMQGTGHVIAGNTIEGGWDDGGENVIVLLADSASCSVSGNNLVMTRAAPISNLGTGNVIAGNLYPSVSGQHFIDSTLRIGASSSAGLILNSRDSLTDSDVVFRDNGFVGAETSLSYGAETGGYWRWLKNITDAETGSTGGAEIARLDATALKLKIPVQVNGVQVLTSQQSAIANITTTASSGTLPTADGSVTIANAASPTVTELQEYCVELEAKVEAVLGAMRTHGLIAT